MTLLQSSNNIRSTFYYCLGKSFTTHFHKLLNLNRQPRVWRIKSSQEQDLLAIVRLNSLTETRATIIASSTLSRTIRRYSLISSREMATSSSNSAQNGDNDANCTSTNKPKFTATKEELKARLSPIQYQVTQLKATERPGSGEYNKFNKKGVYHCVVCNQELFKSETKYESGCGWPAFFDTIDQSKLKFVQDYDLVGSANLLLLAKKADLVRTEVLCSNCNAHLGHRFDDGPIAKTGKRYCINSSALVFIPTDQDQDKNKN